MSSDKVLSTKLYRGYLTRTQLKRPRVSDHALRHTAATLAYRYSRDLRPVQDLPGHQPRLPVEAWSRLSSQPFECVDSAACMSLAWLNAASVIPTGM